MPTDQEFTIDRLKLALHLARSGLWQRDLGHSGDTILILPFRAIPGTQYLFQQLILVPEALDEIGIVSPEILTRKYSEDLHKAVRALRAQT